MSEEIETLQQNINNNEIKPHPIEIELLESNSEEIKNLLNGSDVKIQNGQYIITCTEPIYIYGINFTASKTMPDIEINIVDFEDRKSKRRFNKNNGIAKISLVIKEIHINISTSWLFGQKNHTLKKIILTGFKVGELDLIKENLKNFEKNKQEVVKTLNELKKQNDEHNKNVSKFDTLTQEIEILQTEHTTLETEIDRLTTEVVQLKDSKQDLKELELEYEKLNKEIPKQKEELEKLISDKSIFSTEMAEYVKQANNHMYSYFFLSLIPWILIVCISSIVFNQASDLAMIYDSFDGEIEISAIFWTRLPFIIITISILFVSYEISKVFIQNMMKIQSQKRVFAKIGIIAKDVADKSILGIEDLTKDEKFDLRTKLKMNLLKSHLSHDIGEEYEYKIENSLLEQFKNIFGKKTE